MKKNMKKSVKRFNGENDSYVEDINPDGTNIYQDAIDREFEAKQAARRARLFSGDALSAGKDAGGNEEPGGQSSLIKLDLQPAKYEGENYPNIRGSDAPLKRKITVSSIKEKTRSLAPKQKESAPVSTVSSSEEGMRNYVPRKTPLRQVTQRELAESYVKKRRAAQDAGMKSGGSVGSSASKRGDGIASKGKTRGKIC